MTMKTNFEQIVEIIDMVKDNKEVAKSLLEIATPVAGDLVTSLMDSFGPEISKAITRIELSSVDIKKKIFDAYILNEFTREEAISFMLKRSEDIGKMMSMTDKLPKKM